jgi:kynurenine formamidase
MEDTYAMCGALGRLTPDDVLRALRLVRFGRVIDLEVTRFPFMPGADAHPPFQVVTYRTPAGLRVGERVPRWLTLPNPRKASFVSDLVIGGSHTGTHIDALSHFTQGENDTWFAGESAREFLSDFGPVSHDITAFPPVITRGVLLDIPRVCGTSALAASYGITPEDCERAERHANIRIQRNDVVFIRTGYMTHWPELEKLRATEGAGVTLDTARWLVDRGCVLVGSDTPAFEQTPSEVPDHPRPVHAFLLIESGIPIVELLYLEELSREGIYSFAVIISPLKIRGCTASMVRPLAVV